MSSERYDAVAAWGMAFAYGVLLIIGFCLMPFLFAYIWGENAIDGIRKRLRRSKEGSDVA